MMASYLLSFPSTEHDKLRYHIPTRASGGLWCVSRSSPTLNLSASHLPMVPLLRQGPGFLRDHFVWHSAFHFPLTSSSHPPFISLLTYIGVLPHLVGSSLSRPPWSPSPLPHTHTPNSVPLLNNQANFFPPVSSGQHSPKTLSEHPVAGRGSSQWANKETVVPIKW